MDIFRLLIIILILAQLLVVPAIPAQTDTKIIGLELLSLNKTALARLQQQGFVATLPASKQIYLPYIDHRLPAFVTADSALRTFEIIYQEALVSLDQASAGKLLLLARKLADRTSAGLATLPPEKTRNALERNLARLQLIVALLDESAQQSAPPAITEEIALIECAAERARSPITGDLIDYHIFQLPDNINPTEARVRYRLALGWLDLWKMDLGNESEAREALLLLIEFAVDERLTKLWQEIDKPLAYLFNSTKIITVAELAPTVKYMLGRAIISNAEISDAQIATFRRLAARLNMPAAAFKLLSGSLENPALPDLAAAIKSSPKAVTEQVGLAALQLHNSKTHYSRLLDCFKALLAPGFEGRLDGRLPVFTSQPAWQDRLTTTVLSDWAMYRQMPAQQRKSSRVGGGSSRYHEQFHGFVEPNTAFFRALGELASGLRDKLIAAHVRIPQLDEYIHFVGMLNLMVEKELAAIEFSEGEIDLLENYGEQLAHLSFIEGNYYEIAEQAGAVTPADFTGRGNLSSAITLTFYLVVTYQGERYLCRGAVATYSDGSQTMPYQQSYIVLE